MRLFLSIILFIGILGLGYFVVSNVFNVTENETNLEPVVTSDGQSSGNATVTPFEPAMLEDTVELQTSAGITVTVNNFQKVPGVKSAGSDLYHLGTNPDFQIMYNDKNDSFAINISKQPVLSTRDEAVRTLADLLNISQFELCLLNIYISTTFAFDPTYSNKNIGINGC